VRVHGLAGEVLVTSEALSRAFDTGTVDPSILLDIQIWAVPPPSSSRSGRIKSISSVSRGFILGIEGIGSVADAAPLAGTDLLARADALPEGWDSFAAEQDTAVGRRVLDEAHGEIGLVVDTIVTGANDVWVVHGRFGEVLVPVIDEVVLEVDEPSRTVRTRLLPGLLPDGQGQVPLRADTSQASPPDGQALLLDGQALP